MNIQEMIETRKFLGLTQQQVADALGVTLTTYNRWENQQETMTESRESEAEYYFQKYQREKHLAQFAPEMKIILDRIYEGNVTLSDLIPEIEALLKKIGD